MIEWLVYHLPWYWQAVLALIAWAAISVVAGMLFGWKVARAMLWPAVALIAAFAVYRRAQQEGYGQRLDEEQKAQDKAEAVVEEKRQDIQSLPDDKLDERIDRWTP